MTNKDKLNRFAKAANALRVAAEALDQISRAGGDYSPEANYYKREIDELIVSDGGEVGIDAIIRHIEKELEK